MSMNIQAMRNSVNANKNSSSNNFSVLMQSLDRDKFSHQHNK